MSASLHTLLLFLQGVSLVLSDICYSRVCEFDLVIAAQQSLVYRPAGFQGPGYFDVNIDGPDLRVVNSTFRPTEIYQNIIGQVVPEPLDIITLDGIKRLIITINGQLPGPNLEVTEGAEVVVRVKNMLLDQEITIHWHGLPQQSNPWMDGVPSVTQCPIPTGHTFTYRFSATPAGTFWYHSHVSYQRMDGLVGLLIIHKAAPELPYFPVMLQDWYHDPSPQLASTNPFANPTVNGSGFSAWNYIDRPYSLYTVDGADISIVGYVSGLINGRGRFNKEEEWPYTVFQFQQNQRYLFRLANVAGEYPFQVSIDSHKLRVVALDGMDVQPVTVDSIILYSAERADFEVVADQPVGSYWMRARLPNDVEQDGQLLETLAIVSYLGASDAEPTSEIRNCSAAEPCTVLNCPFKYYPDSFFTNCIHMADVKRTFYPGERSLYGLNTVEPDKEFFLNLNFFFGANFNAKNFVAPTTPLYQTDSESVDCDGCPTDAVCSCTLRLFLPFNKTIQLVMSGIRLETGQITTHPVHIHGHHFAVVRQGFPDYNYGDPIYTISQDPTPDVVCDNNLCRNAQWAGGRMPPLNLYNPPLKDTVIVPASGYVVVRFRSDNPGPWLVHCHVAHHQDQGPMRFLIVEAQEHFPPVPPSMPTCTRNFTLTDQQYTQYQTRAQQSLNSGVGFQTISPNYQDQPPQSTFPTCRRSRTDIGAGGLTGVFIAGLVGGVLMALLARAICNGRYRPVDHSRKQTYFKSRNVVAPGYVTFISGGPRATYPSPMYSSNQYLGQRVYYS